MPLRIKLPNGPCFGQPHIYIYIKIRRVQWRPPEGPKQTIIAPNGSLLVSTQIHGSVP